MTAYSSILTDYLGEGAATLQPGTLGIAPTALGFYYQTDTGILNIWNGATYVAVTGGGTAFSHVGTGLAIPLAGTVALDPLGTGLAINAGTIFPNWQSGSVTALGTGLAINSGTLNPNWQGTVVSTIGPGLTVVSGTLESTVGTTGWNAGSVSSLGASLSLSAGVLAVEASQLVRTIPFPMIGTLASSQTMVITLTQAGTLLANGGTPQGYVGTNPTATEKLVLDTIHNGTITAQGTVSINTGGTITFPSFSAVPMTAGDSVQLVNQATADATFANSCLSFQFQVT